MKSKHNIILFLSMFLLLSAGCRTHKDGATVMILVPIITEPNIVTVANCSSRLFLTPVSGSLNHRKNVGPYYVALKDSSFYVCNVEMFDGRPLISIDEEWKYEVPVTSGRYGISTDSIVTIHCKNKYDNEVIAEHRAALGDTLILSFDAGSTLYNNYSYGVKYSGEDFRNPIALDQYDANVIASRDSGTDKKHVKIKITDKDGKPIESIRFEPKNEYMETLSFTINLTDIGANYVNIVDRRSPDFQNQRINYLHFGLTNSVFPNPVKAKLTDNTLKVLTLDGNVSEKSIPLINIR